MFRVWQVGWLRLGDQTILSMGEKTVIQSSRFSVSLDNTKTKNYSLWHEDEATWNLHINSLRDSDRGCYMCQLNTNPMLSQVGCVDVLGMLNYILRIPICWRSSHSPYICLSNSSHLAMGKHYNCMYINTLYGYQRHCNNKSKFSLLGYKKWVFMQSNNYY